MIQFNLRPQRRLLPALETFQQQRRDPANRGWMLADERRTANGHLLRAAETRGLNHAELVDLMEKVDIMRPKSSHPAVAVQNIVRIDEARIETLAAGTYPIFNSSLANEVTLPGAVRFLPVTLGLLENFMSYGLAHKILANQFNRFRPGAALAGYVDLRTALNLIAFMNELISGPHRLRVPAEALVAVFYASAKERLGQALLLTAGEFSEQGVRVDELAVELSEQTIKPATMFAYQYAIHDTATGRFNPGRYGAPLESGLNTSLLLEIVDK